MISAWIPALIPALLTVVALWGPGLVVTSALRPGKWRALTFAPLASAGVMGIAAISGPFIGVRWGWPLYLGATAVIVALAYLIGYLTRQRTGSRSPQSPQTTRKIPANPAIWPAIAGMLITLPFTVGAFISGIGRPEYPTQTWDGVFHLSAIRWILQTGNGSALNLSAVATSLDQSRASSGGFYPAGFHDLVALTMVGNTNIIVATNAAVIVISCVLWPLAVAQLSSIFLPKSPALPIFTALLAATFSSFPERPASYGVLWPTVYAYALIPLVVIALADWFGRTNQKPMALRTSFIGLLGAIGIAIIHPTGIFVALIAIITLSIDLLARLMARTVKLSRGQLTIFTAGVAGLVGGLYLATSHPAWQTVTNWAREPIGSFKRESFGVIFESQLSWMGYGDAYIDWALGVLTIIGGIVALTVPRMRWLVFTYGIGSYLFVASAVVNIPGYALVSPWYSDPVRLGAIVPLFGAPIAGIGAWFIFNTVMSMVGQIGRKVPARAGLVSVMAVGLIVGTNYLGYYSGSSQLHLNYEFKNESGLNGLVSPEELRFIQTLPKYVREGEVIVGDPRTGLPLVYALTGRDVFYRHVEGQWGTEYLEIGKNFQLATQSDPTVCELLNRHHARYFYTDNIVYWPENPVGAKYDGLEAAHDHTDAFKLVAEGGGAALYEITTCDNAQ
ncbi:DUF6541 family protein [Actinomyces urinae]|uniref:DUF6541 family protein n=1 Tax=Actinomyces urinae TaxID=1689268 RepID=UPI000ADC695E|nr:DUF6541 family protein [Actinomyces urinae]